MTEDTRRQRRDSKRSLPRREEPYQFPLPGYASSELPPTLLGRNQRPESRPPRRLNPSERRRDRRAEESHAEEQDKEVREQRRLAQDNRYNTEADYRRRSRRRSRGPERKGFSSASSRDGHRREQSGSRNPSSKSQRSGPGSEDNFLRATEPRYAVRRRSSDQPWGRGRNLGDDEERYRRSSRGEGDGRSQSRPAASVGQGSYGQRHMDQPSAQPQAPPRHRRYREGSYERSSREEQPRSRSSGPPRHDEYTQERSRGPSRRKDYEQRHRREESIGRIASRTRPQLERSSNQRSRRGSSIDPDSFQPRSSFRPSRPHEYRHERSDDRFPSRLRETSRPRPRRDHPSSTGRRRED